MPNKNNILLNQQINDTARILGIDPSAIEKDFYITEIIHAISQLNHTHYRLVFQGGTCLSKAHKIIPRMSEDCDFRMEEKPIAQNLSKESKRKKLRDFRYHIISLLREKGFKIDDKKIRIRDEGRSMNMRIEYSTVYSYKIM